MPSDTTVTISVVRRASVSARSIRIGVPPVHAEPVDVGTGVDVSNGLPLSEAAGVAVPPADSVGNPVSDAPAVGPPLVGDGDELRPAEPQEHSTTRLSIEAVTAASRERGRRGCIRLMLTVASDA